MELSKKDVECITTRCDHPKCETVCGFVSFPLIMGCHTNPYPIGSDSWHKYNLGIQPNVVGIVDGPIIDDNGIRIEGWYFG